MNLLLIDKRLVGRVVLKADRIVHWHESHVEHRYVTVEGHLCLDGFHVGDVGELFVLHFPELPSVVGRNDVRVVLGISLHRIPHLLVDRPSRVLQLHAQFITSSLFEI